jgi:hypothetical protein
VNFWYQEYFHGVNLSSLRNSAMTEYFRWVNYLLSMSSLFSTFDVEFLLSSFGRGAVWWGGGLTLPDPVLWICKYFFRIRILIRIRGPVTLNLIRILEAN